MAPLHLPRPTIDRGLPGGNPPPTLEPRPRPPFRRSGHEVRRRRTRIEISLNGTPSELEKRLDGLRPGRGRRRTPIQTNGLPLARTRMAASRCAGACSRLPQARQCARCHARQPPVAAAGGGREATPGRPPRCPIRHRTRSRVRTATFSSRSRGSRPAGARDAPAAASRSRATRLIRSAGRWR